MKPQKLTDAQVQATLTAAVTDAVAFIEGEIAPDRIRAQKYFDGGTTLEAEDGRSRVVATKCRDTVRAIKPALLRLFLQSEKPVEFVPTSPQAVAGAEQKTNYARYVFDRNDGFRVLYDVIHDALVKKVGIVKPYWEETTEAEIDNYTGLPPEALAMLMEDDEITLLEEETDEYGLLNITVSRESKHGAIKFDSVPPEDFFIDRSAKSVDDCYVCGHASEGRVGDLVEMGFDFEEVSDLAGVVDDEEEELREKASRNGDDEDANDPSMRKVLITEAYMRMDIEGSGVPKRYKFICAGQKYQILRRELCNHRPFAIFEVDPEPHTFFGRSLVEIIQNDQDAATGMLRGLLDGISWANNPRLEMVEGQVNVDDVLNNEIGAIVRVKAPGMVRELTMGAMSTAVLPAMQYYDEVIRAKTGVVGAGMGLDVDALQSQTAAGVRLADQTTAAVSELIARILAEGGMKQLFEIIGELAIAHPNPDEMMRIDGQFVPVDPRSWTGKMDTLVNVGLGTGKLEERLMVLNSTIQTQMGIWQAYGPQNGLVSMTGMRAAITDAMKIGGIHNVDRYYNQMTPEIEQQILAQAAEAAQQQQQGSDPNAAYLQAEQMKAQVRMQADQQKAMLDTEKAKADFAFRAQENKQADDLARDKMLQDLVIKVAELQGKFQSQINPQAVLMAQDAPRV
jgi:hypothetical protein